MDECERLEWDSAFFGVPIARIRARRLTEALADRIDAWAVAHGIRCLYFLADVDGMPTVRIAEQHEYRLVNVQVTYEVTSNEFIRAVSESQMRDLRIAVPEDIPALRALACVSFRGTRFYNDPSFSDARCDELYATWIERSVQGWADCVYVVGPTCAAYGFVTCHRDGRMGLVAVRTDQRGRGYGLALCQAGIDWLLSNHPAPACLITQGANVRTQRILQRLGGSIAGIALWYHRWLPAQL